LSKGEDQKFSVNSDASPKLRRDQKNLASPLLGDGRYELCEFISKGGMGAIYRAMDQELGRWVALKCLYDTDNASSRDLALREARTLASLNHPNILRVYDVLTVNEQIWIVSEWLEGRCLAQIEKPIPPAAALAIVTQIFSALAAAHEAQVIHRDVKPANIMLGNDGRITLIDFGVAFAPGNSTGQTMVGSLRYTDPRILEGQHPDAHSDLFSTALVLAELMIGEPVLPDLAPLPLYRHIKKNLSYRLESILDGLYPPAASLVRKYADISRLDELHFSSPSREAALLSQDHLRRLTVKSPEEYLAGGICAGAPDDPEAAGIMLQEAEEAIGSTSLSPKQKAAWVAFRDVHSPVPENTEAAEVRTISRQAQKNLLLRRAAIAGKRTQQLVRRKTNFLTMSLALTMMALTVVWMINSNNSKKEDYEKSQAINDLINPAEKDALPDPAKTGQAPATPGTQTGSFAASDTAPGKQAGELDKSALVQIPASEKTEPGHTWTIVMEQPGNLVINGRQFGVVKNKEVTLDYGVHVFEVRRNGKAVSQFSLALSPETPRKITVK
jgi:serine/threonine protein kinase